MLVFINDVIILGGNPDSPLSDDVIYVQPLGILIHKGPPSPIMVKKRAKNAVDSQGVSEDNVYFEYGRCSSSHNSHVVTDMRRL